ncbi:MAG: LacI family transcriptional regulator [Armatimonadetes bacterium]|nr:LacI family transcriptional regulator [Armatimonadota bacterium]
MITISDVAAKAGVSRATVSYVLNEKNTSVKISAPTRNRVLETASELGYRRNELARAMITGKSRMLGFWVMQSNREPVVRVLAGAMKEADENDYFIKMLGFDNDTLDSRTLERCIEWRLAGIIAFHAPEESMRHLLPQIKETGIPFVMVDSQHPPTDCLNIEADHASGMTAIVEHLVAQGHRRIAFLGGRNGNEDSISGAREKAYRNAMERVGLHRECQVEYGDWRAEFSQWESGTTAAATHRLLNATPRPTAIACASDHIAMIVMRLAAERGLQVPQQLSVTGFDDVTAATLYNPPLTTVAQPFEEIGRSAVRHLISPSSQQPSQVLPAHLVVRGSTLKPPSK